MSEILKKIDLSKYSVNFTINKDQYVSTCYGGILSLVLLSLTVLAAVGFGLDMVKRLNPVLMSSVTYFDGYPEVQRDEYDFAFAILQSGNIPINDFGKSFYITLQHQYATSLSNITQKDYLLEKCDRLKNDTGFTNELLAPIENYYCLPKEFKASIIASKNRPVHSGLCFEMYYCNNSTFNGTCRPRPIDTTFYIHFMYKDNYVDSADYENPVKTYWDGERIRTSSAFDNSNLYTFQKMEYVSDNGIILRDTIKYNSFSLLRKESATIYNPKALRMFYTVVNLSRFVTIHSRYYQKVQRIAADAGGIIQFFSILLTIVAGKYSEISFYETYSKIIETKEKKLKESVKNLGNFSKEINLKISRFRRKDKKEEGDELNDQSNNRSNNKIIESEKNMTNISNNLRQESTSSTNQNRIKDDLLRFNVTNGEVEISKREIENVQLNFLRKAAKQVTIENNQELDPPLEESLSNLFVYNFVTAYCCYKKENAVLNQLKDQYSNLMSLEKIYESERKIEILEKYTSLNDLEIYNSLKLLS